MVKIAIKISFIITTILRWCDSLVMVIVRPVLNSR